MALEIVQTLQAPGRGPVGLAWDGRFLWNSDYSSAKIVRIDPQTGEQDIELVCPGNLSGLTWDGRSLWQSLHDGGTLRRINPETNDFDQTIMVWEHGWLSGVTWDGKKLWAISQRNNKVFALDPESGDVLHTIPAPPAAGGLAYGDNALWFGYAYPMVFNEQYNHFEWQGDAQHFALLKVDPASGGELARYAIDFVPMGLTWGDGDLWMSHTGARKLYRAKVR